MAALGFDLNPTDRRSPLHEAALTGNVELIRALLDLGADPTIRDPEHDSPPQGWAEYNREDEAARYLASISSGE